MQWHRTDGHSCLAHTNDMGISQALIAMSLRAGGKLSLRDLMPSWLLRLEVIAICSLHFHHKHQSLCRMNGHSQTRPGLIQSPVSSALGLIRYSCWALSYFATLFRRPQGLALTEFRLDCSSFFLKCFSVYLLSYFVVSQSIWTMRSTSILSLGQTPTFSIS